MNRPDPEYLLGGYATGTLTPEEKALLFEAALRDQALFDALMDEEALRELLADPQARRRLLAALPREKKPLFLRPQILAMAAGIVLLVAVGWMVERSGPPQLVTPGPEEKLAQQQDVRTQEPGPGAGGSPAAPPVRRSEKRAKALVAPEQTAPPAPVPSPAPAPSRALEAESSKAMAKDDAAESFGTRSTLAAKARRMEAAAPSSLELRLERVQEGVEVLWRGDGHLYALKRGAAGVQILQPRSTRSLPGGGRLSSFAFSLGVGESVDVYLLRAPSQDPLALPASAPAGGLWRRIE